MVSTNWNLILPKWIQNNAARRLLVYADHVNLLDAIMGNKQFF
jgi:hypothetical protein